MTRSRIFWIAALGITAMALGVGAQDIQTPAAPTKAPGPSTEADAGVPAMERLDGNRDGRITKAEAQGDPELARRFAELDVDNSGKLEQAEFARFEVGDDTP